MWRGQLHRIFTKAIHEGDLTACKHQVCHCGELSNVSYLKSELLLSAEK